MQSAAGLYSLLPLGVRVQDKLCRLADESMRRVGIALLSSLTNDEGRRNWSFHRCRQLGYGNNLVDGNQQETRFAFTLNYSRVVVQAQRQEGK